MRFVDPKNDLAFKKIFGDENKKEILISFLNSVLDFKDDKTIVDVSLANPYQVPKIPGLKETILDIKAINQNGDKFIVEMQKKDLGEFDKRSLYYTSKAYVEQLDIKQDYTKLNKVYFIGILNFNMFENKSFISRHLIINQETNTQDIKDFEFCFIELKKFDKDLTQLNSILDRWIYFINNASILDLIPAQYKNIKEFEYAFSIANQNSWTKKEIEVYEYISLKEFDEINARQTAIRKAKKKGEKKGEKKGIEKGIEKEKLNIAKNSISQGLDDKTISTITGLSVEQIKKIR